MNHRDRDDMGCEPAPAHAPWFRQLRHLRHLAEPAFVTDGPQMRTDDFQPP